MRERGRYQLQLMKTRSSSGVGMKVDLEFNLESLKITDLPEDEQEHSGASRGSSSIIESIKARSTVKPFVDADGVIHDDPTQGVSIGKVRANVESTKLLELLNKMSDNED